MRWSQSLQDEAERRGGQMLRRAQALIAAQGFAPDEVAGATERLRAQLSAEIIPAALVDGGHWLWAADEATH